MRRIDNLIKKIKREYDKKLKSLYQTNEESILAYIWFKRIHKTNISKQRKEQVITEAKKEFNASSLTDSEFISYLIEKQQFVKEVIQEFKTEMLEDLVENGATLNHVTKLTPKEMGYTIKPSLAETIYNENLGNYVFASHEDSTNLSYAVRTSTGGMFRIGENMLLFPTNNNIEIMNGHILLKTPVYNYVLDIKYFEPVVTVRLDTAKGGKTPTIVFDDEWVCSEPICVSDKICTKIEDVTKILNYFKVFVYNDNNHDANSEFAYALTTKTKRDVKNALIELMKKRKIAFINAIVKENKIKDEISKK